MISHTIEKGRITRDLFLLYICFFFLFRSLVGLTSACLSATDPFLLVFQKHRRPSQQSADEVNTLNRH